MQAVGLRHVNAICLTPDEPRGHHPGAISVDNQKDFPTD